MSHRYLHLSASLAACLVLILSGCNKEKEAPAIIEEVPSSAPVETDTSATLAEEPNLQQVGGNKPGSAKNTFHPSGSGSADKAGFSESGRFVVQVAIFKSKRQAAGLVEKLANSGYPAYVAEVENPVPELSGTYHRVRVGKFLKIADARAFGDNTLKPLGYDFWVDNKKNDAVGGDGSGYSVPEPSYSAPARYEPAAPSEPATPSGETWGTPAATEPATPREPSTPSGETWGTPASDMPGTAPSEPAKAAAPPPASPPPADTGKVNLDEW